MQKEKKILYSAWMITGFSLLLFVPNKRIRQAHVAFLLQQCLTWLLGSLVVQFDLIRYPVRFLKKANLTSFTFEFFVFPAVAVFFNLFYPKSKHIITQLFYYLVYIGPISALEYIAVTYTKTITYKHWRLIWSFITMGITLFLSRTYFKWFFKQT